MSLSLDEPLVKRPHLEIEEQELELSIMDQLPDELLARILDFVDDPWLKIECKGLSRRFYRVLKMAESWNSTQVDVELLDDRAIELNGREFCVKGRLKAFDNFLKVIHITKQFSYGSIFIDQPEFDLPLVKALFGRILRLQPMRLSHFAFMDEMTNPSQLKPLRDFIHGCSSSLQSVNLNLQFNTPYHLKSQEHEAIKSVCSSLEMCNQLSYLALSGREVEQLSEVNPLSFKNLKTLELKLSSIAYSEVPNGLLQFIILLPSLEKLAFRSVMLCNFVQLLADNHITSLPVKELTLFSATGTDGYFNKTIFTDKFDMKLFPNLTRLTVSLPLGFSNINDQVVALFIDRLFDFLQNHQQPFYFNWHFPNITDLPGVLRQTVINKGGRVEAAECSSNDKAVYILNKNNSVILLSTSCRYDFG